MTLFQVKAYMHPINLEERDLKGQSTIVTENYVNGLESVGLVIYSYVEEKLF